MRGLSTVGGAAAACILLALGRAVPSAAAPWEGLYAGADATGESVIALWQFLPGRETEDNSGRGHALTLRGQSRVGGEGPVGGRLESFPAGGDNDRPQGAAAKDADDLSPAGAFTLETWFAAKPEMADSDTVFLFDKKYFHYAKDIPEANRDYCLYLVKTGPDRRRLMASLGFGKDSDFINGPELVIVPERWVHVAFTYDGAGRCRFFLDGVLAGKVVLEGRGAITPGDYDLALGDRFGSIHAGFPGYLAQVRVSRGIVPHFVGGLTVDAGRGRTAFVRMEPDATVSVVIGNESTATMTAGRATVDFGGARHEVALPDLAPNAEHVLSLPVDTALRPDSYLVRVAASATADGKPQTIEKEVPVTIVARPLPNQMPVVMWGGGDFERLKTIGFTHDLISLVSDARVWEAGRPVEALPTDQVEERGRDLDERLRQGVGGLVYVYPGTWVSRDPERKAKYDRVDRAGNVREAENVCGNFPELRQFCYNIGASVAQTFGQYPALAGSLIHSEVRDASDLCFHEHDREAYRQATGREIPEEIEGKYGLPYTRVKGFPPNRVVPDDHPILDFYRWFWKDGDGWNPLHSEIHRGLKSTGRKDLWTFFDPAVRVPDVWGSGGEVDVISQWTYSYPDPIKMGQATDELFAMAEGRPGQRVMKMTQVIWYRSGTAPDLPEDEAARAQWERDQPKAPFITIAPDHMREAFWSKISRPIRGIMYHGWQSLVDTGAKDGYVFTNPETAGVLTELTHEVVQPLGPTLLQVPDRKADVAILESFSSQVFARRGTYGWSEAWEADLHLILQWAHLQPRILFDETVLRDGLDDYRVLAMPHCDVLTEGVVERIKAFQRRGGLVIADEFLCPAIVPDIVIPSVKRTKQADADKAALQARAAALRTELDPFYTRYGDSPDPDVVLRFRQYRDSDYVFLLNDKRTYGNYVGHHGLVMEKGLPTSSVVSVRRKGACVYDLVRHRAVRTRATDAGLELDVDLGPGDGRVYLITDREIAGTRLQAPTRARLGEAMQIGVTVVDAGGEALAAVVPVRVEVTDPQGRPAEGSGFYGAKDGKVSLRVDLAANDAPGEWTIEATELASGKARRQTMRVVEA